MAIQDYNERVAFQQMLDERFPRGAFVTFVTDDGGRRIPEGVEMTVGRVFCSAAELVNNGWIHTIVLDPTFSLDDPQKELQVEIYPITDVEEVDDLYEAETFTPELPLDEVVRLHARPAGPRRVRPGQRDVCTERWESELFPDGIEAQEALADANTTG